MINLNRNVHKRYGFGVGGLKEVVRNWETGIALGEPSIENLIRVIDLFSQNRDVFNKEKIARIALKRFGTQTVVRDYIKAYRTLSERSAADGFD